MRENSVAYSVTQFPAHVAQRLAVEFDAKSVLDFSAGWGDRLSGFLASPCVTSITLIEPRTSACAAYKSQWAAVESQKQLNVMPGNAERLLPTLEAGFDFILSSPPYFNAERYPYTEGDAPQVWQTYETVEAYKDEFLWPVIKESQRLLRTGGRFLHSLCK